MKSVDVTAGTIEYREEGDPAGPPVVLLHGLLMNDAQWNLALPHLPPGFRYLLPVLPIGGHRIPMRDDADLTMPGMVNIVGDFLDALGPDRCHARRDRLGRSAVPHRHRTRQARCAAGGLPVGGLRQLSARIPRQGRLGWRTRTTGNRQDGDAAAADRLVAQTVLHVRHDGRKAIPQDIVEAWMDPGLADVRIRRDLLKYCRTRFDRRRPDARHQPAGRVRRATCWCCGAATA